MGNKSGRKKKIGLLGSIFLLFCVGVAWYQSKHQMSRYEATFFDMFHTETRIIAYGTSEESFLEQVSLLKDKLMYYHKLYDIYYSYSGINNIRTINENAGIAPVKVEPEILEMLEFSKEMYELTGGQINIAMGSVLSIWHEYRDAGSSNPSEASLPSMEELETASKHTNMNRMIIDKEASTVYLADPEMSLDVGGIGKGYAVQKVVEYAREIGMENALLSVGGNICAVGSSLEKDFWVVGIQNPELESAEAYVQKVAVRDRCVVTSGDYQRYYLVDGIEYCHIIDPDTLMPANYFPSVTIITEDSGVADALSTCVFNMPLEEGLAFINGIEGVEAMWILEDGSMRYSDGFQQYLVK